MKFPPSTYDFLQGRRTSTSLTINYQGENSHLDRISFILKEIEGKNAIHLGCADHIDVIQEKVKNRIWLHQQMVEKASRCLGIDNNQEAITFIKELGFNDVLCADISTVNCQEILNNRWDFLVMGEILEHLNNPCHFLSQINERYKNINKIIITVPNALYWMNVNSIKKNIETINSDHRFWFTPYTLAKICTMAGYNVQDFHFVNSCPYYRTEIRAKLHNYLSNIKVINKRIPTMKQTLIMIVSN